MALKHLLTRVLVALSLFYTVLSANVTFDSFTNDPGNAGNLTVAVNVPDDQNSDDLYFRFSASTLYSWAAFGFGSSMSNALVFVMYTASDGSNVTLSPRVATQHQMPIFTNAVNITKLTGSGIVDDGRVYLVNAKCTGCRKWVSSDGKVSGSIDINSESQPLIWATGPQQTAANGLQSNDPKANIVRHDQWAQSPSHIDLKRATGPAGVPVLSTNNTLSTSSTDDAETHEFPIAVHAFLLIACFLFVLPGGYLFLRLFNKVWLHAGVQSLGIVFFAGGVASGIVFNVQTHRTISYHQVLGILTSILILAAFTLGIISHQYFKKNNKSSPLMLVHRFVGPAAIVFGWATIISGFVFADKAKLIIPFMVILLAVVIFVGSVGLLMKKRAMRKAALVTPAAQNFNAGYYQQGGGEIQHGPPVYVGESGAAPGYYAPNGHQGDNVPMQTFNPPPQQSYGYAYPPPQGGPYVQKAPGVNVQQS